MAGFHLFILSLLALTGLSCRPTADGIDLSPNKSRYAVTKIVDGDTFWADNGTEGGFKVRLIGVDAPESRNAFNKKKGFYGEEAKAYLASLLQGKSVLLVSDVDSLDRYGRTLSYVYLEDGTFVNADLVKHGFAMVMTIPPNVAQAEQLAKYQIEARDQGRGLWTGMQTAP